jgi:hypothetical protein
VELSDAKRQKQLEDESAKLKRLLADNGICHDAADPFVHLYEVAARLRARGIRTGLALCGGRALHTHVL